MQRVTHYAEEYETGNIDYVQLLLHINSVREGLNELLGVKHKEEGGLLKQDQIQKILGEPNERTKWVWIEREEREKKLEDEVPIWKKIVFDGKKIQIRLTAFPSIFKKDDEELLVYRLHFIEEFKKPKDQLDIEGKIEKIKGLAEEFSADPSSENAERLAEESVNAEKAFESNFRESSENCDNLMNSIFGSENQRQNQKLLVQEVSFHEGDNFEALVKLELCDECEWKWINLDLWIEGRGPGFRDLEHERDFDDRSNSFESMSFDEFERETRKILIPVLDIPLIKFLLD